MFGVLDAAAELQQELTGLTGYLRAIYGNHRRQVRAGCLSSPSRNTMEPACAQYDDSMVKAGYQ